jgi:hypothetical protein
MDEAGIREQLDRAASACESILGRRPRGTAAPAWAVTPRSLGVQEAMGFAWASDLRGGSPGLVLAEGRTYATPQIPTTGRCIEELLAVGVRGAKELEDALFADLREADPAVLAVHAEVEGGPYGPILDALLARLLRADLQVRTIGQFVDAHATRPWPTHDLVHTAIPGRSGLVGSAKKGSRRE